MGQPVRTAADRLTKDGHTVTVVQNPTISLEGDVATTKQALDARDGPAILVGHSYGGAVITEAGNHSAVKALAYIAAFAPDKGESVNTRGKARPENTRAAMKAEAFEEALSRVSRRVAVLARQAAQKLRAERLEAARAGRQGQGPAARRAAPAAARKGPAVTEEPTGDRALRSPATEKRRASTSAQGARRQAKRDSR